MFDALLLGDFVRWRSFWHDDAIWHSQDQNEFGGDYTPDRYLEMAGEFVSRFGEGYDFRIDDIRQQGELVVVFCGSKQPQLGETDGIMVYRVRDDRIVEGWGIGKGSDSVNPW